MPKRTHPTAPLDAGREEVVRALLHPDRAQHDELGRTLPEPDDETDAHSSPREQAAAPLDLDQVDE